MLTFATGAYVRWLEHLNANIRLLALPAAALSVCAGDQPSLEAARSLNASTAIWDCRIDAFSARRRQRLIGERFGTEAYLQIVHRKSTCILGHLRTPTSPSDILFFVDADVTLFADPRPHFLSLGVDLALMSDSNELGSAACMAGSTQRMLLGSPNATANFNSGFFLMRNLPVAQELWKTMLKFHMERPAIRQQPALNSLLQAQDGCNPLRPAANGCAGKVAARRSSLSISLTVCAALQPGEQVRIASSGETAWVRSSNSDGSVTVDSRDGHTAEERLSPEELSSPTLGSVCTKSPLTFAALNEALFLNGFCFYMERPLRHHTLDIGKIVAVHHNYVEGDERKFKRATAYETITSKADVDRAAFLSRARAAMERLPAWESELRVKPSTQECSNTELYFGTQPTQRSSEFQRAFESCRSRTSKGKRRLGPWPASVAPLCRHTPAALWSLPFSGATWLRIVLELTTGHSTTSMFPNGALTKLMPSEEWPWEGPVPECGRMLALNIRGHFRGPAWTSIACGGSISRAVFLVRHPFSVAWSKFLSEFPGMAKAEAWSKLASATVDTADLANGHWHRHAMYTARLWNYLTSWDAIRVDSAYRVWMKLGRPFLWVRVEDLTDDARGKFVLRSILDFLLHGNYDISQHVLSCALQEAGPLLRSLDDRAAPNQRLIAHAFENTSLRTGDGMWRQVASTAVKLGYTRYSYMGTS